MLSGSDLPVVYAAVFLGVLLAVEGVCRLAADLRHGPKAQINRRLRMLASGADPKHVLKTLRRDRGRPSSSPLAMLERLVVQSGATVSVFRVLLWMAALCLVLCVGLWLGLRVPLPIALFAGLLGGILPPVLVLRSRRTRRLVRFGEQFPGAIDLLVRSLRVGHPLSAALGVVAREMPDPIGTEFGIVVDEVTYGLELQEAIENLSDRVGLPDLRYMVVAINVQHGAGGNLAEVLAGLARVIRERVHMQRKVRAITAEGRMSAWFLSVFPILLCGLMQVINPEYYRQVADEPLFPILAAGTAILLAINLFFMRWLVKIEV